MTRPTPSGSPTTRSMASRARSGRATGRARCASHARSTRACCRSTRTPRCACRTPFGGFKQSGYGRELGPARARRVHGGQVDLLRDRMSGLRTPSGKVCVITGAAGGIGAATAELFEPEGARVVGVDLLRALGRRARAAGRPDRRERRQGAVRAGARAAWPDRRAVQQCRHLPHRRRVGARDHARGLGARPGREPAQRLPLLQARHPPPARWRRRAR